MSEQAFLSGAPVRERADMADMTIEYRYPHGILYVKAKTISMARDVLINVLGELYDTHTFSILNELPVGARYINES